MDAVGCHGLRPTEQAGWGQEALLPQLASWCADPWVQVPGARSQGVSGCLGSSTGLSLCPLVGLRSSLLACHLLWVRFVHSAVAVEPC